MYLSRSSKKTQFFKQINVNFKYMLNCSKKNHAFDNFLAN